MIPGVNPRQVQQMMKQMGMSQEDISATELIIKTPNKNYHFTNPQVQKISMKGEISFQVTGEFTEEEAKAARDAQHTAQMAAQDAAQKAELDAAKAEHQAQLDMI